MSHLRLDSIRLLVIGRYVYDIRGIGIVLQVYRDSVNPTKELRGIR